MRSKLKYVLHGLFALLCVHLCSCYHEEIDVDSLRSGLTQKVANRDSTIKEDASVLRNYYLDHGMMEDYYLVYSLEGEYHLSISSNKDNLSQFRLMLQQMESDLRTLQDSEAGRAHLYALRGRLYLLSMHYVASISDLNQALELGKDYFSEPYMGHVFACKALASYGLFRCKDVIQAGKESELYAMSPDIRHFMNTIVSLAYGYEGDKTNFLRCYNRFKESTESNNFSDSLFLEAYHDAFTRNSFDSLEYRDRLPNIKYLKLNYLINKALGHDTDALKGMEAFHNLMNESMQKQDENYEQLSRLELKSHQLEMENSTMYTHSIQSMAVSVVLAVLILSLLLNVYRDRKNQKRREVLTNELIRSNEALQKSIKEQKVQMSEIRDLNQQLEENQKAMKQAQLSAEQASQAKTSFLFNMSHDIRTPMNAIMGFTRLLRKHQEEPDKRADYLDKIESSSSVLLSIINNVLEMSRIEKGGVDIQEQPWSIDQLVDTTVSVFQQMMEEKGITFTQEMDVKNNHVLCDPNNLSKVFVNILANAYKYTQAGGKVHLSVKELPNEREGWATYQTTISDNGIGISAEFLPHIFEEFARETNSTANSIEGTGLGMPIVKSLVDLMKGNIQLTSERGKGTTVIVTLSHRITGRTNQPEHEVEGVDLQLFMGKHVLLAEDNDLNAEIATEILQEVGFVVDRATDGAICVQMLQQSDDNYYNVVLMDIQMPNLNGYDAARAIRSLQNPVKAEIPIFAMTANAFEEDVCEATLCGMNGHLSKPVNVDLLLRTLASVLN